MSTHVLAGQADAPAAPIAATEWVPAKANGLPCMLRSCAGAAEDVLSMRDGFKMPGIHTSRLAAQMIEFQPCRHGPTKRLVDHPMCQLRVALMLDGPVPPRLAGAGPHPATGGGVHG